MRIGNVDLNTHRFLIAEIGNNHEGDADLAMNMVSTAADSGTDAVKIQAITPDRLVNYSQTERIAQLNGFKLPLSVFQDMADLAESKGIQFIGTPFDLDSLDDISPMVSAIKIASSDLNFHPLLAAASSKGKPIILSTGMGTQDEIRSAVDVIDGNLPNGTSLVDTLVILHCITAYPTPIVEANLHAIKTLSDVFQVTTGYSDHTLGIEASVIASTLGARVIEKHFTMDKTRTTFRDHALSADPQDLERLASIMHSLDDVLGTGQKHPMPSELDNVVAVRRSIVSRKALKKNTVLKIEDLDFVRPGDGIDPSNSFSVLGRTLNTDLDKHTTLSESHLD
ncbi:MAG: N-acetylneuraminate synthase family protein [Chloroflexota bacterium]|nr:N-acetylneuraminate synthase family protein [Chloroflexota bacterium]